MMNRFHIRSFHASHQLNLQPMDNEREYLPWMSDFAIIFPGHFSHVLVRDAEELTKLESQEHTPIHTEAAGCLGKWTWFFSLSILTDGP